MYIAIVVLTMLVLPCASIAVEWSLRAEPSLIAVVGRWFVFWSVGVRLALAGFRQLIQPQFTARHIFHMSSDEALPLVRELGIANAASAIVALTSVFVPSFVVPSALSATLFYGIAGVRHAMERSRSTNETVAMVSDLFLASVLFVFLLATFVQR